MAEYSYELKIPLARVAVVIGTQGKVKKEIEDATSTHLQIDSAEGDVFITGEDALGLYTAREVVIAIGRGFNPELAKLLLKQDYAAEHINIDDYAKTRNHEIRIRGRVIGAEGRARKVIEELTDCHISVYGKTITLIGQVETLPICKRAIEKLLSGSQHSTVYRWLEKQRREIKRKRAVSGFE
ncbi:MAG TPA: KH domain-containing protein [Candidatus Nanoarchaeia archaeon]|nr:KH domain-containing protein [Candidatus Nanoarchaeia archaeon]